MAAWLSADGFAVVPFLEPEALAALRQSYQSLAQRPAAGFTSTILSPDRGHRAAVDAAIRRTIAPAAGRLLPEYRVAFCTFAIKPAGPWDSAVPLHQDWAFVDEERSHSLGLWIPLQDVDRENGCLQVVPGTHAFPHAPRAACTPFAYPELAAELMECLDTIPMRAGEAMVFDNRLFHCSPPNASGAERVAATAVLVPREEPMRYYHVVNPRQPAVVEVFAVADEFFLHHQPGTRPEGVASLGTMTLSRFRE
jgi:hypothetical protein